MKKLSFIIPVYNEEKNISELHKEVKAICIENNYKFEIIIVDDGSTDDTFKVATRLYPVKYIRLRRNFGQTAAIDAGIKNAQYDYIITLDGDRQNDPKDIPLLIDFLEDNELDVVAGWRKNRKDKLMKRLTSRGAYLLRRIIINDGIHDSGCTLKLYKKECFNHLNIYGEIHRFIPALLKIRGFRIGEIEVKHRPRMTGKTKYNWKRSIKGLIDMISVWFWYKYAVRPLHLLGGTGILIIFLGIISSLRTIHLFIKGYSLSDTVWPLLSAFFLITGIQLFISGLISDVLSKNYYESTKNEPYFIKDIVVNEEIDKPEDRQKIV